MGKKKKKKNRKQKAPSLTQDVTEEILALQAIYGEDFVTDGEGEGFILKIVPHPGQLEANFVSVNLHIKYPPGYPGQPLNLHLDSAIGVEDDVLQQLLDQLTTTAVKRANAEAVCVFDLVDECQEYLREVNVALEEASKSGQGAQVQSLWHLMQQRQEQTTEEVEAAGALAPSVTGDLFGFEGGLFADEGDVSFDIASMRSPGPQLGRFKQVLKSRKPLTVPKLSPHDLRKTSSSEEGLLPTPGSPPGSTRRQQPSTVSPPVTTIMGAPAQKGPVRKKNPGSQQNGTSAPTDLGSTQSQLRLPRAMQDLIRSKSWKSSQLCSSSGSGSPDLRGAPTDDSRHQGPSPCIASESASNAESSGESDEEDERDVFRLPLLLGHLVRIACTGRHGGRLPEGSLALVAGHLRDVALMPKWVHWLLTQHPDRFDVALRRLFSKEMDRAAATPALAAASSSVSYTDILKCFWSPPSKDLVPPPAHHERSSVSRYRTDFQERYKLGKGGYGIVTAAINNLDGRMYAIKKIPLDRHSPSSYSRIMREVATLSRLQHPNVVRYFQAWCEDIDCDSTTFGVEEEEDSDLLGWGDSEDTSDVTTQKEPSPRGQHSLSLSFPPRALPSFDGPNKGHLEPWTEEGEYSLWEKSGGASPTPSEESFHTPSPPRRQPSHQRHGATQMLYIQMEFCPRTLHQVLESGGVEQPEDAWQVLRGILAGLAYIHSQGVIHRDLKPANIFYDAKGEIKLGDFGLAKFHTEQEQLPAGPAGLTTTPKSPGDGHQGSRPATTSWLSDKTGMVGTYYYISPEIANGWASYDEKVDLYSLGVVVFELWHPFSTGMERALLLKELRELGRLPEKWEKAHPQVSRLIRWLMSANPADRPSAREVLQSDLLPPRVEDEQLKALIRSLPEDPDTYQTVVEAIFGTRTGTGGTGDGAPAVRTPGSLAPHELPGGPSQCQLAAREEVTRIMKEVFACHGAVPMSSTQVGFFHAHLPPDAVRLLSPEGTLLSLRCEMRYALAAWLAHQAGAPASGSEGAMTEGMKRYEIAMVQRRGRGQGLPHVYLQGDLDVFTPPHVGGQGGRLLAEAEVIKAMTQVLDAIPDVGSYELRLSHRSLLLATQTSLGLAKDQMVSALGLIRAASSASPSHPEARMKSWGSIKAGLEGLGVAAEVQARCRHCLLQLPGLLSEKGVKVKSYLKGAYLGPQLNVACASALEELQALGAFLMQWGLNPSQLLLEPLMAPLTDYYSGIIFQVHLVNQASGSTSAIAMGGRYDGLLKTLWPPSALGGAHGPPGAVGGTINAERLVRLMSGPQQSSGWWTAEGGMKLERGGLDVPLSQADVLVCSKGGDGLLQLRMKLLEQLWTQGTRAEMVPALAPTLSEQYEYASTHGIRWLIILDEALVKKKGAVKVKGLERKTEDVVPLMDVPKYMVAALAGAQDPGRTVANIRALSTERSSESALKSLDGEDLLPLTSDHDDRPMSRSLEQGRHGTGFRRGDAYRNRERERDRAR